MGNTKVSVIIPVYNSSAYLKDCLDSVVNQTYKDIEIICVDDGSTDDSGNLCDEYAEKDSRIQVLHKPNGGVSSARNAGLDMAEGEYIVFIDSDDYVERDYVETLYQNMGDADVATGGLRIVQNGIELGASCPEDHLYPTNRQIKDAYQKKQSLYKFFRDPLKMYRKSTIGNLRFDESINMGEDVVFNLYFLQRAGAVRTVAYCGYNVVKRMDSITHKSVLRYTVSREHENSHYYEIKAKAQKNWGFSDEYLQKEREKANPSRYFHQVLNLVMTGTPYSGKQIREKIRSINMDKPFVQSICRQGYDKLSLKGKISKLSIQINSPWFTEMMFSCIYKIYSIRTRSAKLRKMRLK